MHDLAVLFLHHADDATTRNNLACVRHHNPGVPVVPLSNWGVTLPGGYDARAMVRGWRRLLPSFRGNGLRGAWRRNRLDLDRLWVWRNVDLAAYLWIAWRRRPVRARRWVVFEWDVYANTRLNDWYAANWDDGLTATFIQRLGRDDYHYFNDAESAGTPEALRPWRAATTPWAGTMFSDDALRAIADRVRGLAWCNGFCEVRVATVARSLGLEPSANRNPLAARTLRSNPVFTPEEIDGPSVWHRVKRHDPPRPAAGASATRLTEP